jgi:hypothetical protein
VFGAGYGVLAIAPTIGVAAVAVFVAHLGGGTQWTLSTYGLQRMSTDEFRGRMFATDRALVTITMSASSAFAGGAAGRFGPSPVTAALGGVAALWGVGYLVVIRRLHRSPARPDPVPIGQ